MGKNEIDWRIKKKNLNTLKKKKKMYFFCGAKRILTSHVGDLIFNMRAPWTEKKNMYIYSGN